VRASSHLLFLDFDGVLHPVPSNGELFVHMPLLTRWLLARPSVAVVISSSWRESHPLASLKRRFGKLAPRVIDVTPLAQHLWGSSGVPTIEDADAMRYERQAEIEHWLFRHGKGRPWAALDDQWFMFSPECRNLVVTKSSIGLTEEALQRVDQVLGLSAC
jgi:hypothetical protein